MRVELIDVDGHNFPNLPLMKISAYHKGCVFHGSSNGSCQSEDYKQNSYKVNCVWHYCKYKRKRRTESEADNDRY